MWRSSSHQLLLLCMPGESECFCRSVLIKDLAMRNEIQSSNNRIEKRWRTENKGDVFVCPKKGENVRSRRKWLKIEYMHKVEIISSEAGKMEVLIPLLWLGTVVDSLKA